MNKPAMIDFATATAVGAPLAPAQPQALHDLVPGEARDSLLAVHDVLRRRLPLGPLATYEAGGGSCSVLPPDLLGRSRVTVVDIDEDQVRNNTYADEAILGDVQAYSFGRESFDLVICYNVIEHLPHVDAALLNFRDALKPGGLILIGAPNPRSLSGVVTKYSPHWFHVWFYRTIRGIRDAGLPGEPPFPTFFHPLVTLPKLQTFAAANGLEMIYRREVESPRYPEMRRRKPLFAALVDAGTAMLNAVLPRGTDVRRGDYHVILRKS
ncbi:class I SAM-dependent methyltransferase [Bradyrhizobium diazoefficiens]|nr:class I SAM-dependent methyltransferase [Bradyrhizobium diazoefficiens]UCF52570.1 MAG: class I SAM-dependent methyltransferase [Bradyrhizobium sp.]MBR0965184.1 class I SAM-dependent methyltransferase [Bradyrhizobium diazoefficiens]MBR0977581.1 class I SAM-dependent methyltransferase [Bradyrhizobium diazoefficiens]MBR1007737.1 class I SAM-dependent methyltransferase [Bradyrhizobium diazoefficiens]MBR1013646.1 class I SAM-dependent methyltransferase [Bradyrhizobium diazoefficiens]